MENLNESEGLWFPLRDPGEKASRLQSNGGRGTPICSLSEPNDHLEPKAAKPGVEVVGDKIMTGRNVRLGTTLFCEVTG